MHVLSLKINTEINTELHKQQCVLLVCWLSLLLHLFRSLKPTKLMEDLKLTKLLLPFISHTREEKEMKEQAFELDHAVTLFTHSYRESL